ncbi:MAG: DUF5103 domain-containing protein [Bacteroidales bacterium]|nr:DUF5103 domain-containing protein [Bacteroidales bacterium]
MRFKLLIIILLAFSYNVFAQKNISFSDMNYREDVKSVLFHPKDFDFNKPVINLNNMVEKLHLQFDVLVDDAPFLYYTFIHCTNDWQPSDLQQNEYIAGYFQDDIDNFTFSFNTYINYVHYDLIFPTPDMMPKLSGNYLLVVTGENADDIYFTRRFYVVDEKAVVSTTMPRYPFDLNLGKERQEIDLDIVYPDLFNSRADQYSNVTIQQNGRWDNAVFGLKPTYIYPEKLSYINNAKTVFESGNQYIRINISNFDNRPERTRTVFHDDNGYVVTLFPDTQRNTVAYITDEDLYGEKYIYMELAGYDATKEADYAWVEFFLQWPQYMLDKEVYILGAITDWRMDESSKMEYDPQRRGYQKRLQLKQGYYDYMYIVKDKNTGEATLATVNGDFWETNNMYHIFVYLYDYLQHYDQLIGYKVIRSH